MVLPELLLSQWFNCQSLRCSVPTAKDVIKEIEDFDGLEALRLEGNTVGVEAAKVIAKALEKKSELKVRVQAEHCGSCCLGPEPGEPLSW